MAEKTKPKLDSGAWVKIGFLVFALVLPYLPFTDEYVMHVSILILLYMILALGLNIVPGFNGLLDLGYVGFYGIGAYTSGLLTVHFGLAYWLVIPLAFLNGAIWGVLLGAPTLRLTGDYFAIVTFGFSELVVLFLTNEIWLTRGPLGLPGITPPSIDFSWIGGPVWWFEGDTPQVYYLIMAMVLGTLFVMYRVQNSRLGRAWFAIRDDELAAVSCGINILNYKVIAFGISAAFGAVGGSFYARWVTVISPTDFIFWESFFVLCMIVLGGLGNIWGVMLGAVILVSLGEVLRELLPALGLPQNSRFLFYGLIMVLMMRWRPAGMLPIPAVAQRMRAQKVKRRVTWFKKGQEK
ncbi:MAG: branched-chain amino acid ABC transporter permease [Desulfarculaceae bacterium]|jgi:branched-chain amino acid transport system permease protein